jgi:DNA-binding CsgD family transcriptional regulator
MRIDYEFFGKAGMELSRILQRFDQVNAVNIFLASTFCPGETTERIPLPVPTNHRESVTEKSDDRFYADPEIEEMLRVEALLSSCEPEDLELLHRVLAGQTYARIAEELFMSTNGIKYKVKGLCRQCGTQSRRELALLLEKYLAPLHS